MGLLNLARQGRNGDTRVAHLTPGEVVIPREVAAVRPDLVRGIGQQYSQMGGNPNTLRVGQGKINPRTGIEEFATEAEVTNLYQTYLGRAPESAEAIAHHANSGLSLEQLQQNFINAPERSSIAEGFYNTQLGRAPESQAVVAHHANSGLSYNDMKAGFTGSAERVGQETAGYAKQGDIYSWDGSAAQTGDINNLYQDLYGRQGDKAGLAALTQRTGGLTGEDLVSRWMKVDAKGDDANALRDPTLPAYGDARYGQAWDQSYDIDKYDYKYDAAADKWVESAKKTPNPNGLAYAPQFNSQVDYDKETIEGRITGILDSKNPLVRQAGERVMGQFAQRGIPNSSMAIEAANEAMISKAIEIAGPDAQRYYTNRRENVDWNNKFAQQDQSHQYDLENQKVNANINQETYAKNSDVSQKNTLQQNYLQYVAQANDVMSKSIQAIQGADMSPDAKTSQIAEIQMVFSNAMTTYKETFSHMPGWKDEWAALAPTIGG